MNAKAALPIWRRITFRILLSTVVGLSLTLMAIVYTLLLSWQLEGGGAAINETGSLRMRSYRMGLLLDQIAQEINVDAGLKTLATEVQDFDFILSSLQTGDPKRSLFLPKSEAVLLQMQVVRTTWKNTMRGALLAQANLEDRDNAAKARASYLQQLPNFVAQLNTLVTTVELELSDKTAWLRLCQTALIFLSLAASVALLYLLYLWIIDPIRRLQHGIARMSKDDLNVRIEIDTRDEFGELGSAFNRMADHLQNVHKTQEQRVHQKTAKLLAQNYEVSTLYEIAEFLAGSHSIEELCRGFLRRIMQRIAADGGIVRILDAQGENLHVAVHEGVSDQLVDAEFCLKKDDCLCGTAAQKGVILVRDFRLLDQAKKYQCKEEGYVSVAIFQILSREHPVGSFSLHFQNERQLTGEENRLLETLGKNLGAAIENQRLIAREKEFAVSQERNLLAQGLHDSIAQGLNFLNLQVQMLEDSLRREDTSEIRDIVPLLRAGVQESYEDVRELLSNFRTRLQDNNLESEMRNVLNKFQRQTGVVGSLQLEGDGAQLASEQQLQVLFILQEALSNVRKHAQADSVSVIVKNDRDFVMEVEDNGRGFEIRPIEEIDEAHVGLAIMYERAARMSAQFDVSSQVGEGTRICLRLQREERRVA